jgi:hypothetical protein
MRIPQKWVVQIYEDSVMIAPHPKPFPERGQDMATSAAAPAPNYLAGYDMVVAITQNEINSQFQRLFGQIIQPEISANGLSSNSFLGGGVQLSSWLRGFINAPQVKLSTVSDPLQVLFYFTFQNQNVTAASLGVQSSDLDAAFAKSPEGPMECW